MRCALLTLLLLPVSAWAGGGGDVYFSVEVMQRDGRAVADGVVTIRWWSTGGDGRPGAPAQPFGTLVVNVVGPDGPVAGDLEWVPRDRTDAELDTDLVLGVSSLWFWRAAAPLEPGESYTFSVAWEIEDTRFEAEDQKVVAGPGPLPELTPLRAVEVDLSERAISCCRDQTWVEIRAQGGSANDYVTVFYGPDPDAADVVLREWRGDREPMRISSRFPTAGYQQFCVRLQAQDPLDRVADTPVECFPMPPQPDADQTPDAGLADAGGADADAGGDGGDQPPGAEGESSGCRAAGPLNGPLWMLILAVAGARRRVRRPRSAAGRGTRRG